MPVYTTSVLQAGSFDILNVQGNHMASNKCVKCCVINVNFIPVLHVMLDHATLSSHLKRLSGIDILYTLDSASNYSAIQKLKP